MTGLEGGAHYVGVAGRVEGVVGAAIGERDEMRHQIAFDLRRVDEMGHPEALAPTGLVVVDVDADDPVGADHAAGLDHVQADAAETEDDDVGSDLDLRGVGDGADPGGDAAADIAGLVEGGVVTDFRHRDLGQDGEVRKGRAAHVVIDRLALVGKARGAVGHHPLALGGAD